MLEVKGDDEDVGVQDDIKEIYEDEGQGEEVGGL